VDDPPAFSAAVYDTAYRRGRSPAVDRLWRDLDPTLPPEVEPFSFVSTDLLTFVADALAVAPGAHLVDLGCGRGGPGLWLARHTGAHLTGIDWAPAAVEQATARAPLFARADHATFHVADLTATGLPDATADAVVSLDALHFAPDPHAAAAEVTRLLRPASRFVLTGWQPVTTDDPRLAPRHRHDWPAVLAGAGLHHITVHTRPAWTTLNRRLFDLALAAGDPGDDESLANLQAEARAALPLFDLTTRVAITAAAPTLRPPSATVPPHGHGAA
jgi:SAM-dependent methyltransferase